MKITTYFPLFLVLCLFISCKQDNASINLLRQAEAVIDNEPEKALALLDSIHNPENMDKDNYMQYIVRRVQAKYEMYQDVTSDTLIFEAQKYFDAKNNPQKSVLANYYAGGVNYEMKRYDKSLNYFLRSSEYAKKTGDNKLSGKIYEYIGALYLEQGLMDSAAINYKKSVNYFNIEKDSTYLVRITNQIGRAYEDIGKLDSAYIYFNAALQIADKVKDLQHVSSITLNLGVTSFGIGEYDKAIEYFRSALSLEATNERQVRKINLYLLKTFNKVNDLVSAKEYAIKIESNLPDVTDIHTKKVMYSALAEYYKLTGDYKQSVHYSEQEKETIQQIAKEERPVEMIKADADFRAEQKDKIYRELQSEINFYLSLGIGTVLIVVIFIIYTIKRNKKEEKYFQQEKEEYQQYKDHVEASDREYDRIDAEIKEMLEDTEEEK